MKNQLRQFDEGERVSLLAYGTLYASREASISKKQYEKQIENCDLCQNIDVLIIRYLERLGFPLDEMGTYLYKDVIVNVIDALNCSDNEVDRQQLMEQLNHTYSQFYFNVAKYDNDMGVNIFHAYIQKALDKINSEKKDFELVNKLFKASENTLGYGEKAFLIGNAIRSIVSFDKVKSSLRKCKIM